MKRVAVLITMVLFLSFFGFAQNTNSEGGLFRRGPTGVENRDGSALPMLPNQHLQEGDQPATPIGGGMVVLTACGVVYALSKKHKTKQR